MKSTSKPLILPPTLVPNALTGQTLATVIRKISGTNPIPSWSDVRRVISTRKVMINGSICLDDSRRVNAGETIQILSQPARPAPKPNQVRIFHADEHLIVVDKPAGIQTLRRHEERHWDAARKALQPTLDELIPLALNEDVKLHPVHRLDRDTSGLMLFALTKDASIKLIRMFKKHQIDRRYIAVVYGTIDWPMTIDKPIVRDRGDGIRGIGAGEQSQPAITHIRPIERIGEYTMVECQLETGRTHQIRIHLTDAGHMLCGEKVYTSRNMSEPKTEDRSRAPRQALHSASIRFIHPITDREMAFASALPKDLASWIERLRQTK